MDDPTCASCGAAKSPSADYCWRCYTPFAARSGPARGQLLGGSYRAGTILEAGSARTMVPERSSRRHAVVPILIRLALTAAVIAGGWWVYRSFFAGFPFPDEFGGEPRLDSQTAGAMSDAFEAMFRIANVEGEIALYGEDEMDPAYGIAVLDIPTDPIDAVGNGGRVTDYLRTTDLSQMRFECGPSSGPPLQSVCVWPDGDDEVVVVLGSVSPDQLRPVAEAFRADLG